MSETLIEESVYECNDLPMNSVPLEEIVYVGFSVQPFKNLDLLDKLNGLQFATFRLCAIDSIPKQFFSLPNLKTIDLSGNAIAKLPDSSDWENMKSLTHINISENNINEFTEILKLSTVPNLIMINFSGNICSTANDTMGRIVGCFPKITIINDSIVTMQYKAYVQGYAIYEQTSILPTAKADDFFFSYIKYMHVNGQLRHIRKYNAESFCLHRALRRNDAVVKIQSVFRGFRCRVYYKKFRAAGILIQQTIRNWYNKRRAAAQKIASAFLRYKFHQEIKLIRAVRYIQSIWRRRSVKGKLVQDMLEVDGKIQFYLTETNAEKLHQFCKQNRFQTADEHNLSDYVVLREREPRKLKLPGSPLIYYNSDQSYLIRKLNKPRELPPAGSMWCTHDHSRPIPVFVNKNGVKRGQPCIFTSVKLHPDSHKPPKFGSPKEYEPLILCEFSIEDFKPIMKELKINCPSGMRLLPVSRVPMAAAAVSIKSAMISFKYRQKYFRAAGRQAVEARALKIIQRFFMTSKMNKIAKHVSKCIQFYKRLPKVQHFFVSCRLLGDLMNDTTKTSIPFAFNADREVILNDKSVPLLSALVPSGNLMFQQQGLRSLLKFGTTIMTALPTMFVGDAKVTKRSLNKFEILRIAVPSSEELMRRAMLFTWITGRDDWLLNEDDVIEICAAAIIRNGWRAHLNRISMQHMAAQVGRHINTQVFIFKKKEEQKTISSSDNGDGQKVIMNEDDPRENIAMLRGDYRPWKDIQDQYKSAYNKDERLPPRPVYPKAPDYSLDVTLSKKGMGLVDEEVSEEAVEGTPSRPVSTATMVMYSKSRLQASLIKYNTPRSTMTPSPEVFSVTEVLDSADTSIPGIPKSKVSPKKTISPQKLKRMIGFESDTDRTSAVSLADMALNQARAASAIAIAKPKTPKSPKIVKIQPTKTINNNITVPQNVLGTTSNVSPRLPIINTGKAQKRAMTALSPLDPLEFCDDPSERPSSSLVSTQQQSGNSSRLSTGRKRTTLADELTATCSTRRGDGLSSQLTDNTMKERAIAAFTRLAHLHQLGETLVQEEIVDNTLEIKRNNTLRARTAISSAMRTMKEQKANDNQELRERFRIEQSEREEAAAYVKQKSHTQKVSTAKKIRHEHKSKQDKYTQNKKFAQSFVSATRQLAQKSEMAHRRKEEAKAFEKVRGNMAEVREGEKRQKEQMRQRVKEEAQRKIEGVKVDRELLAAKRDVQSRATERKMENLSRLKEERREAFTAAMETRARGFETIVPNPALPVETDDIEGSAAVLSQYMGANLGFVESHMLSDMIYEILNY